MSTGISAGHSTALLNILRNTAYAGISPFLKLHDGDPGANGTANPSAETSRKAVTFGVPSPPNSVASAVQWTNWSAGSESVTHVSLWDASSAGNFIVSAQLSAPLSVTNTATVSITPTLTAGTLAA